MSPLALVFVLVLVSFAVVVAAGLPLAALLGTLLDRRDLRRRARRS